jgi:hypothetical protein
MFPQQLTHKNISNQNLSGRKLSNNCESFLDLINKLSESVKENLRYLVKEEVLGNKHRLLEID